MISLEDLERDALTELVNIGVSRAAVSLRKMVGKPVAPSVPALEVMTGADATKLAWQREHGAITTVMETISGPFSGRALLIFPDASGKALARILAGDSLSDDEVAAFEDEALAETGNVVLNACLGSIGNMLQRRIHLSPPIIIRGDEQPFFDDLTPSPDAVIIVLYINFGVEGFKIAGYIALVMDMPSLTTLKEIIGRFIERAIGGA